MLELRDGLEGKEVVVTWEGEETEIARETEMGIIFDRNDNYFCSVWLSRGEVMIIRGSVIGVEPGDGTPIGIICFEIGDGEAFFAFNLQQVLLRGDFSIVSVRDLSDSSQGQVH